MNAATLTARLGAGRWRERLARLVGRGKDADAGKLTYPKIFGIEGTRSEISRLLEASQIALQPFGASARSLGALAEYLARRTK